MSKHHACLFGSGLPTQDDFFFTISSIYDIILLLFKQTNDQNKTNCSFPVVVDLSGLKDVHAALFRNINPKFVFISAYQSLLLKA